MRLAKTSALLQEKDRALTEALERETARDRALVESREQQTATSEILGVISSSPTHIQPVFDTIIERAVRLCDARLGALLRFDGQMIHLAAHAQQVDAESLQALQTMYPMPVNTAGVSGRALLSGTPVHVRDMREDPELTQAPTAQAGHRTVLSVPMMREGAPIGAITVARARVEPFTDRQVELLQTFADQAVIAIENVRLFTELQTSNRELTTALDKQTATADILRVISRSQTDVQPVFDAILGSAVRLLRGYSGVVTRIAGDQIELAALTSADAAADAAVRALFPRSLQTEGLHAQAIRDRAPLNIADAHTDPGMLEAWHVDARVRGYRSVAMVPMLRRDEAVGTLGVFRREPGGFTDDETALLQTFADQAVIAIENARLLSELQERNEALTQAHAQVTEALEQQTATSEILRVIASSPTDVQPVFDTIAQSSVRLCQGARTLVCTFDGEMIHLAAYHNATPEALRSARTDLFPLRPRYDLPFARAILTCSLVHVSDVESEPGTTPEFLRQANVRSALCVPLLRSGQPIGVIAVSRSEPTPFSDTQSTLLQTFADQAVIAIENVRLFTELQTSNRELTTALDTQTATADILRVISRSQTDVQPVFDAIVASAVRLLGAYSGLLTRVASDQIELAAHTSTDDAGDAAARAFYPQSLRSEGTHAQAIRGRAPVNIADAHTDPRLLEAQHAMARARGYRSQVVVPLLRHDEAVGAIGVTRREPGGFTDEEIALLKTFADQAVIAIENVRLFKELEARNKALTEALEQQTATSEILRVISSSPTDVQPVFDAIAESSVRLCDGLFGAVYRFDGELMHFVAHYNFSRDALHLMQRQYPTRPRGLLGCAIRDRAVVHSRDVLTDPRTAAPDIARVLGYHSYLAVPMLRESQPIGGITVCRAEAEPFSNEQIKLLQTFADQAIIAIENVRLFTELEARNAALTESLDQQTATGEVLRVISSSPTDLQPVFDAMLQSAVRLLEGFGGTILRYDGTLLHLAAVTGGRPQSGTEEWFRSVYPLPLDPDQAVGQAILGRRIMMVPDIEEHASAIAREIARRWQFRALVIVPMLREGVALGTITVTRATPGPFSGRQIELLRTFADQAVIAIENTRLFTELQTSNRELTTALDTQTATSDILRVISRSQTDVQPVFDAILTSAVRLLGAYAGVVTRLVGDQIELAALTSIDEAGDAALRAAFPYSLQSSAPHARAIRDRAPINLADFQTDSRVSEAAHAVARLSSFRSLVVVPLLRHDEAVGAISVARREPGGFTDDEIALLQTFADQAVIAIENARLLSELQTRTAELTQSVDQLTALGEVGQAISSTLDLQTVLCTIVARATQLADADAGVIYEYDEPREVFLPRAIEHLEAEIVETMLATPVRKGEGATGRLAEVPEPIQVPDILAAPAESRVRAALVRAGYRALLAVPLVSEDQLLGGLTVTRKVTGEFAPEVVELLRTFATQSALAIQNARLFREIEIKSRELEVASQHKSEFLASMSHELRTPLNAIIGFSDVLLQGMFGEMSEKQTEYLQDILASGQHLLSLINDILDLSKIEAGRMELDLADFHLPSAIDDALLLMRERAGRRGLALERHVDERLGEVRADQRKVKQVLLNLLSNAVKFTPEGGRIDVRAAVVDGTVEISVTDTGIGIAPEDQDAVFEEFRQVGKAEKKAEGTGLGLALCRKFVELHAGRIWVKSQMGAGSTFTFALPLSR